MEKKKYSRAVYQDLYERYYEGNGLGSGVIVDINLCRHCTKGVCCIMM